MHANLCILHLKLCTELYAEATQIEQRMLILSGDMQRAGLVVLKLEVINFVTLP